MNIYKINTSIYDEENFVILTTLTAAEIQEVIEPIVKADREGYEVYDLAVLLKALKKAYPIGDRIQIVNEIIDINI